MFADSSKSPALSRKCSTCKQIKSVTEFYTRGKHSPYYCAECKDCMKLRSRNQRRVDRKVSVVPSEGDVIHELLRQGIPALPGKALAQQWADVIAFGAVLIEVKSSKLHKGQFNFAFTPHQQRGRIRGDLVVLVCRHETGNTFHVFPSSHPMFRKEGKVRFMVTWTPNRKRSGRRSVLTDAMMAEAENNWQLVHDYLKRISDRLRFGEQLPILLNAA